MADRLRNLGSSDIKVSSIGLGGNQFSGRKGVYRVLGKDLTQEQINDIISTALNQGINWFDTAEIYGGGRSEAAIAAGLKSAGKRDDEVVIGTKWFPLFRNAGSIRRTIQRRLHSLGGYSIDIYMIHYPWGFSSIESQMEAMADLAEMEKIRSIGVSNFNSRQMMRAQKALKGRGLSLVVNQVQYSLLNRKIETNGILQAARDLDITIVAWYPLGSGILSGKYHQNPDLFNRKPLYHQVFMLGELNRSGNLIQLLSEISERHSVTPAQVALNWLINFHGDQVVAIPGASEVEQVIENAGAMDFTLSNEEMDLLDISSRDFR